VRVGSNSRKSRGLGAGDPAAVQTAVSYLAAAFGVASQGTSFEVYREGLRHQVRVVVYKSFALLILEVDWRPGLKTPDGRLLTLTREQAFHRTAKRLGFAIEPETGDAEFDRYVYIATRLELDIPRALLDGSARRAAVELLRTGWELLAVHAKTIQATRTFTLERLGHAEIAEALTRLMPLARAAERLGPRLPLLAPRGPGDWLVIPAYIAGFGGAAGLIAQSNVAFLPGAYPHLISVGVGLLVAVALLVVAALRFRGRSTLLGDLAAVGLAVFLAVPLALAALLPALNELDSEPPRAYPSVLLQVSRPSRGVPALTLSPIAPGESTIQVSDIFDYRAFERRPGEEVTLFVRQGFFGWSYIESVSKRTSP
jgi:hypothetical protein